MPKVLTAARVRVPAQHETEYVSTLRELSQFAEARGQKIWLFRNAKDPRLFIEFSESPTEMSHRAQASRDPSCALPDEARGAAHVIFSSRGSGGISLTSLTEIDGKNLIAIRKYIRNHAKEPAVMAYSTSRGPL